MCKATAPHLEALGGGKILNLASSASDYVAGAVFVVDGGMSLIPVMG